jgi:hypothetical protein
MSDEDLESTVAFVGEQLAALRGGQARIWYYRYTYSVAVIRVTTPDLPSRQTYVDCARCSRVTFIPAWEPANLEIKDRPGSPHAPLLVTDQEHFRVECQTVRVAQEDAEKRMFPPTCGLRSSADLIDRIPDFPPGFPLADHTLSALAQFVRGYEQAMRDFRFEWNDGGLSLFGFQEWLRTRLHDSSATAGWHTMLKDVYGDGPEAYNRFFELWHEYKTERNQTL